MSKVRKVMRLAKVRSYIVLIILSLMALRPPMSPGEVSVQKRGAGAMPLALSMHKALSPMMGERVGGEGRWCNRTVTS